MKFNRAIFSSFIFLLSGMLLFTSCQEEGLSPTGKVEMKITDAPSDDASIQGVFVTVAEVKIDGERYDGFQGKQTIDIMAYQNGNTKALGLAELEAGSYSNISLVLDTETDADGNSPGCYVLRDDNSKEDLAASGQSSLEISSQTSFEVVENATSSIVLDFDLRKSIQYEDNSSSEPAFSFVSQSELNTSVRTVEEDKSGNIDGSFETSLLVDPDKVVVYVYEKGTFNKDTETQAQGSSNLQFKNAISSTTAVKASGSYSYNLSFLEEGDYEVCMVSYQEDEEGKFGFQGFLNASVFLNGAVTTEVSVSAGIASSLNLNIIGIVN